MTFAFALWLVAAAPAQENRGTDDCLLAAESIQEWRKRGRYRWVNQLPALPQIVDVIPHRPLLVRPDDAPPRVVERSPAYATKKALRYWELDPAIRAIRERESPADLRSREVLVDHPDGVPWTAGSRAGVYEHVRGDKDVQIWFLDGTPSLEVVLPEPAEGLVPIARTTSGEALWLLADEDRLVEVDLTSGAVDVESVPPQLARVSDAPVLAVDSYDNAWALYAVRSELGPDEVALRVAYDTGAGVITRDVFLGRGNAGDFEQLGYEASPKLASFLGILPLGYGRLLVAARVSKPGAEPEDRVFLVDPLMVDTCLVSGALAPSSADSHGQPAVMHYDRDHDHGIHMNEGFAVDAHVATPAPIMEELPLFPAVQPDARGALSFCAPVFGPRRFVDWWTDAETRLRWWWCVSSTEVGISADPGFLPASHDGETVSVLQSSLFGLDRESIWSMDEGGLVGGRTEVHVWGPGILATLLGAYPAVHLVLLAWSAFQFFVASPYHLTTRLAPTAALEHGTGFQQRGAVSLRFFFGRWRLIRDLVNAALERRVALLVIGGPPRVGKTWLARVVQATLTHMSGSMAHEDELPLDTRFLRYTWYQPVRALLIETANGVRVRNHPVVAVTTRWTNDLQGDQPWIRLCKQIQKHADRIGRENTLHPRVARALSQIVAMNESRGEADARRMLSALAANKVRVVLVVNEASSYLFLDEHRVSVLAPSGEVLRDILVDYPNVCAILEGPRVEQRELDLIHTSRLEIEPGPLSRMWGMRLLSGLTHLSARVPDWYCRWRIYQECRGEPYLLQLVGASVLESGVEAVGSGRVVHWPEVAEDTMKTVEAGIEQLASEGEWTAEDFARRWRGHRPRSAGEAT